MMVAGALAKAAPTEEVTAPTEEVKDWIRQRETWYISNTQGKPFAPNKNCPFEKT